MSLSEIHEIEIENLATGGDGVGHLSGQAVFIPGTVPGDKLRCRIILSKGKWARGEMVELLSPGPERVEPPCPVAGQCGGCQWQHVSPHGQQTARIDILENDLTRIAQLESWPEIQFHSDQRSLGYRRRVEYQGAILAAGTVLLGFFGRNTHRIVNHERCPLLEEQLDKVMVELRRHLQGRFRRPGRFQLEATLLAGPAVQILFKVEKQNRGDLLTALGDWRPAAVPEAQIGVRSMESGAVILDARGAPFLLEELTQTIPAKGEVTYPLYTRPGEFVQANRMATGRLVGEVLREVSTADSPWLLDLYCGAGNFSIPLAMAGAKVLGLEVKRSALRSARKTARLGGIGRARFRAGAVGDILPELAAEGRCYETVVLDPPRQGAPELVEFLDPLQVQNIVAVSCHSAALARDIKGWATKGFQLRSLKVFDLFPQTFHSEVLACLTRKT